MMFPEHSIPRIAEAPELSTESVTLLTELCFLPDSPYQPADTVFVFGNMRFNSMAQGIKDLLDHQVSEQVIISGSNAKNSISENKLDHPEAEEILNRVKPTDYPQVNFQLETQSTNTVDNVEKSLDKFPEAMEVSKIFYVFLAHASRRAFLSLRKYLPEAEILIKNVPARVANGDALISKDNWFENAEGKGRVWGEFLRIKKYGERGDIAYDAETKDLVDKIIKSTS